MNIIAGGRVRIVRRHSGPEHRHHMFYPGNWRDNEDVIYRDAIGRKGNETWAWLPMICAMSEQCTASVLVRRDLLDDIAQFAMDGAL